MESWDLAIEQSIRALGTSFDTHRLIQKIAHLNQRRYVEALAGIDSDIPFQVLHSRLGRRIKVIAGTLGYEGTETQSDDMFGQYSHCTAYSTRQL